MASGKKVKIRTGRSSTSSESSTSGSSSSSESSPEVKQHHRSRSSHHSRSPSGTRRGNFQSPRKHLYRHQDQVDLAPTFSSSGGKPHDFAEFVSGGGQGQGHARNSPAKHAYPRNHSFVVDMNNRPVYENELHKETKKPGKASNEQVHVDEEAPVKPNRDSLAHLPATNAEVYYPKKKGPLKKVKQTVEEAGCCCKVKVKVTLAVLLILLGFIFLFAILGEVISLKAMVAEVRDEVDGAKELLERFTRRGLQTVNNTKN